MAPSPRIAPTPMERTTTGRADFVLERRVVLLLIPMLLAVPLASGAERIIEGIDRAIPTTEPRNAPAWKPRWRTCVVRMSREWENGMSSAYAV